MKLLALLEQMIRDRSIWFNAKTLAEVEVREENLVQTVTHAHARFDLPADFGKRKRSTNDVMNALLVRQWVNIRVMAGATFVHAATTEMAQAALKRFMSTIPVYHVLVETGAVGRTHKVELKGFDEVKAYMNGSQS